MPAPPLAPNRALQGLQHFMPESREQQMANLNQGQAFSDASRFRQIQENWQQHPGAMPGGTGPTGLNRNDAQGWARMQNENLFAMNHAQGMAGEGPMNVRNGGNLGGTRSPYDPGQDYQRLLASGDNPQQFQGFGRPTTPIDGLRRAR